MAERSVTVHMAGPPQMGGLYQTCTRCGYVLQDFTGGQVMVVDVFEPADDRGLPTWPVDERIGVSGNATYVVGPSGRPLDDDERECRAVS